MIARDDLHAILDLIPEDRLEAAREALASADGGEHRGLTKATVDHRVIAIAGSHALTWGYGNRTVVV